MKLRIKKWSDDLYEINTLYDDRSLYLDKTEMQDLASLMKEAGF